MSSALWSCISDAWMSAIWKILWQGSLSIGIVWAICKLWTRMPPFFKSWLWRLVYLKLLIAFVWSTPLQVPIPAPVLSAPVVAVRSAPSIGAQQNRNTGEAFHAATPAHGAVREPNDSRLPISAELAGVLMLSWVVGVLLWSRRLVGEWSTVRALSAECIPVDDERLIADVSELCARLGIRRVPALIMHRTCGPMLLGLRHPTIILPDRVLRQMSREDLRPVLAHELAHLKRGDLLWDLVASIAQGLFFFHPLIRLSRREFALAQEMACDAVSMEALSVGPDYYGQTLLSTIKNCVSSRPTVATAGIGESYHALERRLIAMSRAIKLSKRLKIVLVIALAGLAIAGLVPLTARMRGKGNIHIVYKSVWSRPALPKEWVDDHIAGLHERLVRELGPKRLDVVAYNEKAFKAAWQIRYKPQTEVGRADYWGTPTEMVWVFDRFGHSFFASYNGKYVASGPPSTFGLRPRRKGYGNDLLISELGRGRLEEDVPYLGFTQPGLRFYNAKRHLTRNASGWEERWKERAGNRLEYVYRYNRLRQPVSLELRFRNHVSERYQFSDPVRFQGVYYPKTVVHTNYYHYKGKAFAAEIATYKAISVSNEALSGTGFDVERPPKDTYIQDLRPEFTNDSSHGLIYTYRNTKRTLSETSAIMAARWRSGDRHLSR